MRWPRDDPHVQPILTIGGKWDDLAGEPHAHLEPAKGEPADGVQGKEVAPDPGRAGDWADGGAIKNQVGVDRRCGAQNDAFALATMDHDSGVVAEAQDASNLASFNVHPASPSQWLRPVRFCRRAAPLLFQAYCVGSYRKVIMLIFIVNSAFSRCLRTLNFR